MADFIDIYLYKPPFDFVEWPVCAIRQKYLDKLKSARKIKHFTESTLIWQLLSNAVYQSTGKTLNELNPRITKYGKWVIDNYYFSISHDNNCYAVAISNSAIGIDVQQCYGEWITDKFLSIDEIKKLAISDINYKYLIWTKKEALYKALEWNLPFNLKTVKAFDSMPNKNNYKSWLFTENNTNFYLTIYSAKPTASSIIKLNTNIKFEEYPSGEGDGLLNR